MSEFGVASQEDLLEARLATEVDRLVEIEFGLLLRGAVAATVDQVKRLGRVGQRDHQGMIAPRAVVGDVDTFLALGVGGDKRAVPLDDRLGKELGGLLGPDPPPRFVNGIHQLQDLGLIETTAEVPGRGRVGNALGAHGIEIDLVVTPQFDVLDPLAAAQNIERDIQYMVGFVVGQMPLEDMDPGVDVADQPSPMG